MVVSAVRKGGPPPSHSMGRQSPHLTIPPIRGAAAPSLVLRARGLGLRCTICACDHRVALIRHPRCLHPGQQQGRRLPARRSSAIRTSLRARVSGFFAISIQQIHSLRASGVRSAQVTLRSEFSVSTARKSDGTLCTTPPGTAFAIGHPHLSTLYPAHFIAQDRSCGKLGVQAVSCAGHSCARNRPALIWRQRVRRRQIGSCR